MPCRYNLVIVIPGGAGADDVHILGPGTKYLTPQIHCNYGPQAHVPGVWDLTCKAAFPEWNEKRNWLSYNLERHWENPTHAPSENYSLFVCEHCAVCRTTTPSIKQCETPTSTIRQAMI